MSERDPLIYETELRKIYDKYGREKGDVFLGCLYISFVREKEYNCSSEDLATLTLMLIRENLNNKCEKEYIDFYIENSENVELLKSCDKYSETILLWADLKIGLVKTLEKYKKGVKRNENINISLLTIFKGVTGTERVSKARKSLIAIIAASIIFLVMLIFEVINNSVFWLYSAIALAISLFFIVRNYLEYKSLNKDLEKEKEMRKKYSTISKPDDFKKDVKVGSDSKNAIPNSKEFDEDINSNIDEIESEGKTMSESNLSSKELLTYLTQIASLDFNEVKITQKPILRYIVNDSGIFEGSFYMFTHGEEMLSIKDSDSDLYLMIIACHSFGIGLYSVWSQTKFGKPISDFEEKELSEIANAIKQTDPYELALGILDIEPDSNSKLLLDKILTHLVIEAKNFSGDKIMDDDYLKSLSQVAFNMGVTIILGD